MRIVLAPDSFKESMTALQAAEAMATGVHRVLPDAICDVVPMADGGEGTRQTVTEALGGVQINTDCHDALGRPIQAAFGYVEEQNLAIIEMSAASGLELIPPSQRDVMAASTFGTGELIRAALDRGARRFIVGIGGSATNDAGAGMASALGARFLDAAGIPLPPGGGALQGLASLDISQLDKRLAQSRFDVACDVDNPLLGAHGAAAVFGPQKGATPAQVKQLDAALTRWADVVESTVGRSVRSLPGAGAAGGLGAALAALIPTATLRRGVDIVADAVNLADRIRRADWVFTGEGRIDAQTINGKTTWGVLQIANRLNVPVIMFGGTIIDDVSDLLDATALVPIVRRVQTLQEALRDGPANLADAAQLTMRLLRSSRGGGAIDDGADPLIMTGDPAQRH